MSANPASVPPGDEHDPELVRGLIDLASQMDGQPPRSPADPVPILDLLRLAAPSADGQNHVRLGKYTLERSLGAGAYGAVWQARDGELKRTVAIKIPHSHVLLQPDLADQYAREIELMARLDHSHIVTVHDVYRDGGLVALVMAYCAGPSLAVWLAARGTPAPPQLAARILRDLAQATQVCHQRAIVHGDIKPSNVLLFPNGEGGEFPFTPKLTDFGLASLANAPRTERESSLWRGTLEYMAPEQIRGDEGARGVSSDIYSLGVVLYELLTGTPPFVGPGVGSTLARVLTEEPLPPRSIRPDIPRDLERICLKCLAKELGDRYLTAAELAAELHAFLEERPVWARPNSWVARWRRYVRRPERVNEAATLTILLHAAIMVWMFLALVMSAVGVPWLPPHMTSLGLAADSLKMGLLDALVIGLALGLLDGRRWAAGLAATAGLLLALFSAGNLSGWIEPPFDGVYAADRKLQVIVFSLLTVLFAVQGLVCGLAWLTLANPAAAIRPRRSFGQGLKWTATATVLGGTMLGTWLWSPSSYLNESPSTPRTAPPMFPVRPAPQAIPVDVIRSVGRDHERIVWGPVVDRSNAMFLQGLVLAGRYANPEAVAHRLRWWPDIPGSRAPDPLSGTALADGVTVVGYVRFGDVHRLSTTYVAPERTDDAKRRRFSANIELAETPGWFVTNTGPPARPHQDENWLLRLSLAEPDWPIPNWQFEEQSASQFRVESPYNGWCLSHINNQAAFDFGMKLRPRIERESRDWLAPTWRLHEADDDVVTIEHGQLPGWFLMRRDDLNAADEASQYLELRPLRDGEQPTRWRLNRVQ